MERLAHAEDLRAAANGAHTSLVGGEVDDTSAAVATIDQARRLLEHAGAHDPALAALATRIAEAGYLLADAATDLAGYLEDLQADPLRLDAAQRRRSDLASLTRTYGSTVDEVLEWADSAGRRLLDLDGGDQRIESLQAERATLDTELASLSERISAGRGQGATSRASVVSEELSGLAMGSAELQIVVEPWTSRGPHGGDRVEMLLVPHAGAPARPLGKGASGGSSRA